MESSGHRRAGSPSNRSRPQRPKSLGSTHEAGSASPGITPAQEPAASTLVAAAKDPRATLLGKMISRMVGKGADLGGLAGSDAPCQKLAAAMRGKIWQAYLTAPDVRL